MDVGIGEDGKRNMRDLMNSPIISYVLLNRSVIYSWTHTKFRFHWCGEVLIQPVMGSSQKIPSPTLFTILLFFNLFFLSFIYSPNILKRSLHSK